MKEHSMTEQEHLKYLSAYYELLNNKSILSSERDGVKSVSVRRLMRVDDLSRPEELKKGEIPAVVVWAIDRSIEFWLSPGESMVYDQETNTASFTSNETKYTISSAEGK
jgi:hypothetical protein